VPAQEKRKENEKALSKRVMPAQRLLPLRKGAAAQQALEAAQALAAALRDPPAIPWCS